VRLLTFEFEGAPKLGVLNDNDEIIDVAAHSSDNAFSSMQNLIEAGPEALALLSAMVSAPRAALAAGSVTWLSPLPVPVQMRDFIVFEEHMRNAGWNGAKLRAKWGGPPAPLEASPIPAIWYKQPIYYKCNRFAATGPDSTVRWPTYSTIIDYELEVACIIGLGGRDISAAAAPKHIFGYTIFNDLTARDAQFREMQGPLGPAKGKDFDCANVLGPLIVTADSVDASNLKMCARINGEVWSAGSTATMHWSFADMIAHVSCSETLHSGEILGSGTVGGGCGLELGRFLQHDDVIELEVAGIGRLSTRIHAPHVLTRATL
jgi:2-keto-4-pentenoate hydratase/2-oxohepta-3-ene-1,7-dioic acid hydratase in catechol pathway